MTQYHEQVPKAYHFHRRIGTLDPCNPTGLFAKMLARQLEINRSPKFESNYKRYKKPQGDSPPPTRQ